MTELKKMHRKTLISAGIAGGCIFLASSFCFLIQEAWIPLGFLLGLGIGYLNYFILYLFSYKITRPYHPDKKWILLSYLLRMCFYALGLVLCLLFQYRFSMKIFFWGSLLAGYLLLIVVIAFGYNPGAGHKKQTEKKDL